MASCFFQSLGKNRVFLPQPSAIDFEAKSLKISFIKSHMEIRKKSSHIDPNIRVVKIKQESSIKWNITSSTGTHAIYSTQRKIFENTYVDGFFKRLICKQHN